MMKEKNQDAIKKIALPITFAVLFFSLYILSEIYSNTNSDSTTKWLFGVLMFIAMIIITPLTGAYSIYLIKQKYSLWSSIILSLLPIFFARLHIYLRPILAPVQQNINGGFEQIGMTLFVIIAFLTSLVSLITLLILWIKNRRA